MSERTEQVQIGGVYLPRLAQRQDDLMAQLLDLHRIANRLGMYDAADFLDTAIRGRRRLENGSHGEDGDTP